MAEKFILSNGMTLLVEYMPSLHSASVGLWINTGSAREQKGQFGVSHLLEHMLFKGTAKRTSLEISSTMDDVGGVLNAFTTKEHTCFYARCLDEHFPIALDLLADMYSNSLFDAEATEKEKSVVIEEINMYQDEPDDAAYDLFAATMWPQHPYGRNISGSASDVAGLTAADVANYWKMHYHAGQTTLAVAGHVLPEQVVLLAEEYFSPARGAGATTFERPAAACGDAYIKKDIEQNHICMGFPAISIKDEDYYAAAIVNNAFGGSSSSRLFQEVREKRGLSYSPFSGLETLSSAGYLMAYASTQPNRTAELTEVLAAEFGRLLEHGLTSGEIRRNKEQIKGAMMLSMESSAAVMSRMGKYQLIMDEIYSLENTVKRLMAVTEDDIARVIKRIVQPGRMVLAQVGPEPNAKQAKGLL